MSKALGIDLGTSNTVVAAVIDGEPRVLTDDGGAALQASVVSFPTLGGAIVGNDARERVAIDPGSTIRSSKRLMGRPIYSPEAQEMKSRSPYVIEEGPNRSAVFKIGERRFSPEEIAAQILTHMSGVADRRLGEQVRKAVITVPASFKEAQRSATLRAGTMAGLDVLRLLNEPTAAALAYGFDQNPARQLVAIYDLGGGTFDITILEQRGNIFEVRSTAGDTFLGGDDLDDRIANSMCDVVERETGFDPRNDLNFWQRLRVLAEQTKCALSVQQELTIDIEAKLPGERTARSVPYSLDRQQFNEWAMEIIQRTLVTCDEALRLARIQSRDVDALVLVGGSTRIPVLRDSVGQYFFQEPRTSIDPDQVVAIGAAIFAESLANPGYGTEVPDVPSWGDTAILRMPGAVQSGEYDAVKPLDSLDDDGATTALSRDEMEAPDTEKMDALETANTMDERRVEAPVERTERRAPPQRQKPLLLDVTSHAIGVETLGGIFDIIIDRNARVPVSRTKLFTTTRRGQTVVRLRVYEGVERKARQNHRLGELVLTGLKPDERGATRIAVTLSLDTSGMLTVDARDDETGSHAEVDLEVAGLAP